MVFRTNYRRNHGFNLGPLGFLIVANLIMYLATSIRPSLFINLFGLSRVDFLAQPWTIATNMFIHLPFPSIGHILANMLTLYFFGTYLTRLVGEKNFLFIYFAGGLLGNIFHLFMANPFSTAIGASGAVFAVGGTLAVLRPKLPVYIFPFPVPLPLWVVVIGGFFIMTAPNIAWQAHLGGLVLGLAAGYFLRKRTRSYF